MGAPETIEEKDHCPECNEEVDTASSEKIIVQGKVFHVRCYRAKYGTTFEAGVKPQDDASLPNCPICDLDVHASDSSTYVGGRPFHSQCYQDKYGKEKQEKMAEELDQCPSCGELVELSDMSKVIVNGEAWHQGCYRREHVTEMVAQARPQDDPTLPNCPICDQDVHASDSQSWHGGEPYHTRCWDEKYGKKEEAAAAPLQDICPECSEVVDGTAKLIVKGVTWHERCYRAKHHIEKKATAKPQDDPNLPNCPICDQDVHPSSNATYVAGEAYHSHCYAQAYGAPVTEKVEDVETCPECGGIVEKGTSDKIISGGVAW